MQVDTSTPPRLVEPLAVPPPDDLMPTAAALVGVLADFVDRGLPHRRIARLTGLLHFAGVSLAADVGRRVAALLQGSRHPDGAWVDVEDTTWCLHALDGIGGGEPERRLSTVSWLAAERAGAAWGYCSRDRPCIPISATVRLLVPCLADAESAAWLAATWSRDLAGPYRLSYKASWYLLASGGHRDETGLLDQTVEHLLADQRPDGGWGPWRDHAAATDCLSTGLAMWALATSSEPCRSGETLGRAVEFCARSRLDNALFPTHYIDEGSAWMLLGWAAAVHALSS